MLKEMLSVKIGTGKIIRRWRNGRVETEGKRS